MLHHRRKIKPTSIERAVWGEGQAESLQVVTQTPFGKIGALNCWENYQPLLRYAEYSQGVEIHVASWPTLHEGDAGSNRGYHVKGSANLKLCQVIAMEGAAFVMVATSIYRGPGSETQLSEMVLQQRQRPRLTRALH
jgi:nitrilase